MVVYCTTTLVHGCCGDFGRGGNLGWGQGLSYHEIIFMHNILVDLIKFYDSTTVVFLYIIFSRLNKIL